MKYPRMLKLRYSQTLITLLITLLLSACGASDNFTNAIANISPDLNSNSGTDNSSAAGNEITATGINLSWAAPAEREDSSAISLSEIAGYQVFYGQKRGQYTSSVTINDGTAVGYTFTDFPTGTYYFVVTTLDTEGRESQFSSEVEIII